MPADGFIDYASMQQAARERIAGMERMARNAIDRGYTDNMPPCAEHPNAEHTSEKQSQGGLTETALLIAVLLMLIRERGDPLLIAAVAYLLL